MTLAYATRRAIEALAPAVGLTVLSIEGDLVHLIDADTGEPYLSAPGALCLGELSDLHAAKKGN
jgi:hypothetical protein